MCVEINGIVFTIVMVDAEINTDDMYNTDDSYTMGLTNYRRQTISIRKGLTDIAKRQTVIHELVHAFMYAFGYTVESEEAMCNFFGSQADNIMKLTEKIMKGTI